MTREWPPARIAGDLIERPRLYDIVNEGRQLTVVSGPAGSGKSTLLAQWASSLDAAERDALIHVPLGSEDSGPRALWRIALEAVVQRELTSDVARVVEDLRAFDSIRNFSERMAEIFSHLASPCTLVIDNLDGAADLEGATRVVEVLEASPDLRIVTATRRSMTRPFLNIYSRVDTAFIGPSELLFTADESYEVVSRISRQTPPVNAVGEISALPLTARIVGLALRTGQWPEEGVSEARALVADAVSSRIFTGELPDEMVRFLDETSIPNIVTVDVAARLGWHSETENYLSRAEELGLGMWQAQGNTVGFAYSPLVRDALRQHLLRRPAQEVADLRRKVASWARKNGLVVEALTHAIEANDYYLASLIGRESWFIFANQSPQAVLDLMRRVPTRTLNRFPVLSMVIALILVSQGKTFRAMGYFDAAIRASARQSNTEDPTDRIWIRSIQSLGDRFLGHFSRAAVEAREVSERLATASATVRRDIETSFSLILSNCGTSLAYAGYPDEAVESLERGLSLQVPNDNAGWYHCAALLAMVTALRGDLLGSRRALTEIDEGSSTPEHWRVDIFGFPEQVARALIACEELDFVEARRCLDSVAFHLNSIEHWPYHALATSRMHLLRGRAGDALAAIDNALRRGVNPRTSSFALNALQRERVMALLSLGHGKAADRAFSTLPRDDMSTRVLQGFCHVMRGQFDDALKVLGGIGSGNEEAVEIRDEVLALLSFACAAEAVGDRAPARAACDRALAIMSAHQLSGVFLLFSRAQLQTLRSIASSPSDGIFEAFLEAVPDHDRALPALGPPVKLTPRETAVLRALIDPGSTVQIAQKLSVSPNTVKAQLRTAYRKLGVTTRTEAVRRAAELGLLGDDPNT